MTDDTYNGWKNYPTWAVNLWLSNDEGLYRAAQYYATEALGDAPTDSRVLRGVWTTGDAAKFNLSDTFKNWVSDEIAPDLGASFAADLLGYALGCVDWDEIASAWLEGVDTAIAE